MSNPGQRDNALEVEEHIDVENGEGGDGPGPDEGGDDALDGDAAGGDGDHLEEDDAAGNVREAGEQASGQVRQRSPATLAVQAAKRAAKAAQAEAEAARREAAELRAAQQGRQTEADRILEQERLALMPHDEKLTYLLNKQEERTRQQVGALEFRIADASDRSGFESLCVKNPAFASVRDEVEEYLANARRNGSNPNRETVATYLIGKRALERANKGGRQKQVQRGQESIQRQQARPAGGRGDVPPAQQRRGGSEQAARRARLENLDI